MKVSLSRRRFLRRAGVSIALPLLPSLTPRGVMAQASTDPKLLVLFHPNGTTQRKEDGTIPAPLLDRLTEFRPRMSIVRNMNNNTLKNRTNRVTGHPHMSTFLPLYSGDVLTAYGEETQTFDQVIAADPRHQGRQRPSLSIALGTKSESQLGVAPVYFNTISWRGAGQPVAPYTSPRRLFEELFADAPVQENPELRARLERRQQFLDVVIDEIREVRSSASSSDRIRLDEYLTGVEELDRRTASLLEGTLAACSVGAPPEDGETYPETLDIMQDLAVRALQCDATRVLTFMHGGVAGGGRVLTFPHLRDQMEGALFHWHPLSHWLAPYGNLSNDVELNRRDFERLLIWLYDRMADFLRKLDAAPGASGGSVLDETLVTLGSNMGYAQHHAYNLYQLLIGDAGGRFRTGVEVDAAAHPVSGDHPTANLWLTLLQGFGLDAERFGQSTTFYTELLS